MTIAKDLLIENKMKIFRLLCLLFLVSCCLTIQAKINTALPYHGHPDENFMIFNDIHFDADLKHPMSIDPKNRNPENDLDKKTLNQLFKLIETNILEGKIQKPAFILVLGDNVGHKRQSKQSAANDEIYIFKKLKQTFPNIPKFYVFGNEDSLYKNYGPFQTSKSYPQSPYQLAIISGWKNGFLSTGLRCRNNNKSDFPCLIWENKTQGYYIALLRKHLELIVLNSILFSVHLVNVKNNVARDELIWLRKSLENAYKNHNDVLLAMHISLGKNIYDDTDFWFRNDEEAFLKIIDKHHANILAILVAHTHMEELKLIINPQHYKIPIIYTAALSTSHGNAPSLKIFNLKKNNHAWHLADYVTYRFSLDNNNTLALKPLYDFDHYYCRHFDSDMRVCLSDITAKKVAFYYTAGNPKFYPKLNYQKDIIISR